MDSTNENLITVIEGIRDIVRVEKQRKEKALKRINEALSKPGLPPFEWSEEKKALLFRHTLFEVAAILEGRD